MQHSANSNFYLQTQQGEGRMLSRKMLITAQHTAGSQANTKWRSIRDLFGFELGKDLDLCQNRNIVAY